MSVHEFRSRMPSSSQSIQTAGLTSIVYAGVGFLAEPCIADFYLRQCGGCVSRLVSLSFYLPVFRITAKVINRFH